MDENLLSYHSFLLYRMLNVFADSYRLITSDVSQEDIDKMTYKTIPTASGCLAYVNFKGREYEVMIRPRPNEKSKAPGRLTFADFQGAINDSRP